VCPEIEEIKELCQKKDLFLIEDAAHAHGSMIEGKPAGSIGSAGCFSFYPTKVLTSGEGGMVTTNDEEIAKSARIMRDQGKETFSSNVIVKIGYNWRMPEICAAIGLVQLKHLNEFIERRNQIAKVYDEKLDTLEIEFVKTPKDHVNNYYKYTFFLPKELDRSNFKNRCRDKGVLYGGEVYWPPLHLQPAFRDYVSKDALFRVADDRCARMVNPPIFSQMTVDQANRVCEVTRNIISELTG
jgi:dTDP-4-amino-4,6-dideoxygalactose transaminase